MFSIVLAVLIGLVVGGAVVLALITSIYLDAIHRR